MSWSVVLRPEVEADVNEATEWYESQQSGLGDEFREEIIRVFDILVKNPLLQCRRHPRKNIRWRYPERFPYRVVYEVLTTEKTIVVAAVIHAARHDRHWRKRV